MCSPTWETHVASDMCSPTCEAHITSDMCSLPGKHISLVICVPVPWKHISLVTYLSLLSIRLSRMGEHISVVSKTRNDLQ